MRLVDTESSAAEMKSGAENVIGKLAPSIPNMLHTLRYHTDLAAARRPCQVEDAWGLCRVRSARRSQPSAPSLGTTRRAGVLEGDVSSARRRDGDAGEQHAPRGAGKKMPRPAARGRKDRLGDLHYGGQAYRIVPDVLWEQPRAALASSCASGVEPRRPQNCSSGNEFTARAPTTTVWASPGALTRMCSA